MGKGPLYPNVLQQWFFSNYLLYLHTLGGGPPKCTVLFSSKKYWGKDFTIVTATFFYGWLRVGATDKFAIYGAFYV